MPANVDALVQEGITALKAGNRADARRALTKAVELNDQNEQAWLWLAGVVETLEDRRICLENVLELNPGNTKATKGLQATLKEIQDQQPQNQQRGQAAAPAPDPFGGAFDVGTPFAKTPDPAIKMDTGFDVNPYTNANQNDPALSGTIGGWAGFDAAAADWGLEEKPAPSTPSRDVGQPSEAEYDNWMAGLSIGASNATSNSVPAFDTADFDPSSGPFGSSSTFGDDPSANPFATPDPFSGQESNPFDTMGNTSAFGDYNFDDSSDEAGNSPFSIPVSKPSRPDSRPDNSYYSYEEAAPDEDDDQPASGSDFDFGAEPPVLSAKPTPPAANSKAALGGKKLPSTQSAGRNVFDGVSMLEEDAPALSGTAVFTTIDSSPSMDNPAFFFKQIPPEIQANSGSPAGLIKLDPLLVASLVVLVVLNVGSLLFLLTNLGR